jgi:hypothetical protein
MALTPSYSAHYQSLNHTPSLIVSRTLIEGTTVVAKCDDRNAYAKSISASKQLYLQLNIESNVRDILISKVKKEEDADNYLEIRGLMYLVALTNEQAVEICVSAGLQCPVTGSLSCP